MLSSGPCVSVFSRCFSRQSSLLLELVRRVYMRALVTCCTALTGCPFKSFESQKIQSSERFFCQRQIRGCLWLLAVWCLFLLFAFPFLQFIVSVFQLVKHFVAFSGSCCW